MNTIPTVFMNHGGGPMPILGEKSHVDLTTSLKNLTTTLNTAVKLAAILVISAHWEETDFQVLTSNSASTPIPLYFDYSGFPSKAYQFQYAPPGAPLLADRVVSLLTDAGFGATRAQTRQGYDHGVFIPLMLSFPQADIPVVQLSLKHGLNAQEHVKAGQALSILRSEGVLIYGSGMSYHNMRSFMSGIPSAESALFDQWLNTVLGTGSESQASRRLEVLSKWLELAPHARRCHPREEHLAPLFVVAGAAGNDTPCHQIFSGQVLSQIVSSFAFIDKDVPSLMVEESKNSDL